MLKRIRFVTLAIVAMLTLASAGLVAAQDSMAHVRVMHLSPDAPAVDVFVNGNRVVEGLAFPNATDYLSLQPGEYRVQVAPAGAPADQAVIDATVTLEAKNYSVAAVGMLSNIQAQVLEDNSGTPAQGKAHVRILHASPDAPAVDIAVAGGPTLVSDLSFPEASDYVPVDASSYDIEVRAADTDQVALSVPDLAVEAGMIYTVAAVGMAGDGSLMAEVYVDRVMAATGTGGGNPTMPNTGAGGASLDSSSTNWLLIGGISLLAMLVGGSAALATRRVRVP